MDNIKALPSIYGGVRFRSRLEARWAIFFDKLGVKWEYEPEGFDMDGVPYLPDFRLYAPNGITHVGAVKRALHSGHREDCKVFMYAEVKPHGGDFTKANLLPNHVAHAFWPSDYNITAAICLRLEGPPSHSMLRGKSCVLDAGRDSGGFMFSEPTEALVGLRNGKFRLLLDGQQYVNQVELTFKSGNHSVCENTDMINAAFEANNYRFDRR